MRYDRLTCHRVVLDTRRGFTLVEILVVIAIIGVLVALLLPAVQMARESARRTQCINHLKQIGLATLTHHDARKRLPAAWEERAGDNESGHTNRNQESALVRLLPYLEEANQYVRYNSSLNIFHDDNKAFVETIVPVYLCPSMMYPEQTTGSEGNPVAPGSYVASTSTNRPDWTYVPGDPDKKSSHTGAIIPDWKWCKPLNLRQILDGTSKTFAFGEFDYFGGTGGGPHWAGGYVIGEFGATYGDDDPIHPVPFNPQEYPEEFGMIAAVVTSFRSEHPGGAHFVMVDGSVHFISEDIDPDTLDNLAHRDDGNIIEKF